MLYQFKNLKTGEIIERDFPMREAPELGTAIRFKGKNYHRILSMPSSVGLAEWDQDIYPKVSRSLPRNLEGCPHDSKGRPIILNKQHEREVLKRTGYVRAGEIGENDNRPAGPAIMDTPTKPNWNMEQLRHAYQVATRNR